MDMGAQENNHQSDTTIVSGRDIQKRLIDLLTSRGCSYYAHNAASMMAASVARFKKNKGTFIDKDGPLSTQKLSTLYMIDKAYDRYVCLKELLQKMKAMRFDLKFYCNRMDEVFKQYHKLRDRSSDLDAVLFSDIMDCYEEKYGEDVANIEQIILSTKNPVKLSYDWQKAISLLFMVDGLIMIADYQKKFIGDSLSSDYLTEFNLFEFVDYEKVSVVSRRSVLYLNGLFHTRFKYSDECTDELNKLCHDMLVDKTVYQKFNSYVENKQRAKNQE